MRNIEELEMSRLGFVKFDSEDAPLVKKSENRVIKFIKNNKAMVFAITIGAIGFVSTVLYFLLRENDHFTPTNSPFTTIFSSPSTTRISTQASTSTFLSTTSGTDTTTFFSTADPRCEYDEDCCDRGVWICGR